MRTIIKKLVYSIESEPGDLTHYSYYLLFNTTNGISIIANKSTFPFPTSMYDYETTINNIDEAVQMLEANKEDKRFINVNPYTLLEVCQTIREILKQ